MTDLLLVSLGTTRGLRLSDAQLVAMLRGAGASVEAVATRIGLTNALRRGYPVNDLVELRRLGAAARQTVAANFTWARCGAETVAAYRTLLSTR